MAKIVVVDYGASNLRSVVKALQYVADNRHEIIISNQSDEILSADKVVFPGQGAIGQCMNSLGSQGLDQVIKECIKTRPFLGICLGLQSLMDSSDEDGGVTGMGIIPGRVIRFRDQVKDEQGYICKIPHMGWNNVNQHLNHPLWEGIEDGSRFYFVHSYYVVPADDSLIAATTDYTTTFTSAVAMKNIFATQFHPEKSQRAGLTLLENFLTWGGEI